MMVKEGGSMVVIGKPKECKYNLKPKEFMPIWKYRKNAYIYMNIYKYSINNNIYQYIKVCKI